MRLERELGPIAGVGDLRPADQPFDLVPEVTPVPGPVAGVSGKPMVGLGWFGSAGCERELFAASVHLGDPLSAQIIAPPFEDGVGEVAADGAGHQGEVVGGQLVLEGLGGGCHHDRLVGEGGRDEIGQGLAGAGAGLDHQMATLGDGPVHLGGHLALTIAALASPR